MAHLPSTFSLH